MRTLNEKAKSGEKGLKALIAETAKLWRRHHLTYDQIRYVSKEVRKALGVSRVKVRKRVVQRLSREEERRLIQATYRDKSEHGLLIKTLLMTGTRITEFVNLRVQNFFFEEAMIPVERGK
jgi:integrase/recombinase XerD